MGGDTARRCNRVNAGSPYLRPISLSLLPILIKYNAEEENKRCFFFLEIRYVHSRDGQNNGESSTALIRRRTIGIPSLSAGRQETVRN